MVDSRSFLLPHRRNRVYGVASLVTPGGDAATVVKQKWLDCWRDLRTNVQFPMEMMFHDKPREQLKDGRHSSLVQSALQSSVGNNDNLFVDCSSSTKRITCANGAIPCITRNHPVWSCRLHRYLTSQELMNAQGLWESTMSASTYQSIISNDTLSHCLAGNSFSSTVVQCAMLASFVVCGDAWKTTIAVSPTTTVRRRVFGKKPPPEGYPVIKPVIKRFQKPFRYTRKVAGVDSRKFNTGKKVGSTIFEKERVTGP